MSKTNSALAISAWTSGAAIAIGTNVDIGGVLMGPGATTITLKIGTTTVLSVSAGGSVVWGEPVALPVGVLEGTSSGGSFAVLYRKRG